MSVEQSTLGGIESTPQNDAESFTYHHEPAAQGGARYVRCEGCGREIVPADPDRLLHRDGCPNA